MASNNSAEIDDVEVSTRGLQLFLNNELDESQKLLDTHRYYSPLMHGTWSFVSFMRAVISFDEQRLTQAGYDLSETEKLCANESTNKFKRPLVSSEKKGIEAIGYEEYVIRRILIADCKLYQSILMLIKQELAGLLSAGLLLRKSWKIYEKIHRELYDLFKTKEPNAEQIYGSKPDDVVVQMDDEKTANTTQNNNDLEEDESYLFSTQNSASTVNTTNSGGTDLPLATVKRLLASVSFGYGLFQIALSFIPPRIMKLIKFLGFEGDRKVALTALYFASQSQDVKAPLANLTLLWYHVVIVPFFAIDLTTIVDTSEAETILKLNFNKFGNSTLFIYFQGRMERLQRNLPKALATFHSGLSQPEQAPEQKNNELQQILMYDVGWCYMMMLDFNKTMPYFIKLKDESRWSKSFYCYVTAVCTGAMGDIKASTNFVKEGIKLLQKKSNPVELFVQKRLEYLKKNSLTVTTAYILVFEMLYLWTTVPCCEHDTLRKMLEIIERFGTDSKDDSRLRPIACLVEGAIQHVLMNLDNAQNCYEEALARVDDTKLNFTRYVAPFSTCELGILEYLHHRLIRVRYSMSRLFYQIEDYIQKKGQLFIYKVNPNRAKEMLTKAKDKYSEFDFDNRLQIRSVAALKMINSSER